MWACALLSIGFAGCSNLVTQKAIEQFAAGVHEKDLEALKESTSSEFGEKALRHKEAMVDLKTLNLPDGKVQIVDVQETAPGERKVYVTVGENEQKLEYRLVQDKATHKWVVDDVVLPKNTKSKAAPISRSVTDQMDLLLSLREFLESWQAGTRDEILAVCAPDLRQQLEPLPEPWLTQMAQQVVADAPKHKALRPEARVDKNRAVLMLGKLVVNFEQIEGHWQLTDAAAEAKDDTVRSVRKLASCLGTTQQFLQAYGSQIKTTVQEVTTPQFYDTCLAEAELDVVPLPVQAILNVSYKASQQKNRTEIQLEGPGGIYMFTMSTGDLAPTASTPTDSANARPKISEVTIFEKGGSQVKRMSSVYLSQALLLVYADALVQRDRMRLDKMSTEDFRRRVWSRGDDSVVKLLPFPEIESAPPEITATVFQGDVTEVTVTQGSRALTYVLHSTTNGLLVDDVLMPVMDRPSSLKANAEQLIPVYQFALGVYHRNLKTLRQASDEGLNRIVWMQLRTTPDFDNLFQCEVVKRLTGAVDSIRPVDNWSKVQIGGVQAGCEVTLVNESGRYLVHDVTFVNGSEPQARRELLRTIRNEIAATMLKKPLQDGPQAGGLRQVEMNHTTSKVGDQPGFVESAVYEVPAGEKAQFDFLDETVEVRE
jgi:hypothetical protein